MRPPAPSTSAPSASGRLERLAQSRCRRASNTPRPRPGIQASGPPARASMLCGGCGTSTQAQALRVVPVRRRISHGRQPTYFIHGEVSDQNLRPSHGPDRPLLPRRRDRDRLCPTHAAIIDSSFGREFDGLRYLDREGSKLGRPWSLRGIRGLSRPCRRGWERISASTARAV